MSFREQIQALVEAVPGATAAVLMGYDGIAVDSYQRPDHGIDSAAVLAEFGATLQQFNRSGLLQAEVGPMQELLFKSLKHTTVLRPLNEAYYLAMVLRPDGISGKARFMMRLASPQLLRDLA